MFKSCIYNTKESLKKFWESRDNLKFDGYIWLCESGEPPILLEQDELPVWHKFESNFIWEMNAYAAGISSLSIRFLGGCWIVNTVDWKTAVPVENQFVSHNYLTKQFNGKTALVFEECWQPVCDPLCAGMQVLKPSWIAFKGFKPEVVHA